VDDNNKKPKFAPGVVLSRQHIANYYKAVLSSSQSIVSGLNQEADFSFLWDENYEPIIVG
jgi:hypothetical protein